ncbi:MAG: hypothetical protein F6K42_34165 [Leptolyngbya sp. SIO1D8]|nr:hypothetical protein [Leptolyngbya sp. SIO1D8]
MGNLVGPNQHTLYSFDRYREPHINLDELEKATHYYIQSNSDPRYQQSLNPVAVYRKSKPLDVAQVGRQKKRWPMHHTFYLELPTPLIADQTYQIQFLDSENLTDISLTFHHQPDRQLSEAIHVSHIGFRPDDPVKVGFLSSWLGTGGHLHYPEKLLFQLVDDQTNMAVFSGETTLRKQHNAIEDARDRTYTLTDVYQLNFSQFDQPGQYRLCVEDIGCSFSFPIAENTWQTAFHISAKGFYHQRSGIALNPPYTQSQRPRPFHPDDGLKVYQSKTPLMDSGNGLNAQGTAPNNFTNLIQGKTDILVPDAWGGYFDAGDWDRRIQHLEVARTLLELLELFPDYFEKLTLNLPESDNSLPDLLDEALWGVDFFKRLQTLDGGIRGGIESMGHPKRGEVSWQESLTVMAYAPGPWSSYIYAGVAARVARILQNYAPEKALEYRQSALSAMNFAEHTHQKGIQALAAAQAVIEADRALAALEIYRLTLDNNWHQLFLTAKTQAESNTQSDYRIDNPLREITFLYTQLLPSQAEVSRQDQFKTNLLEEARQSVLLGMNTAFGWTKQSPMIPVGWGDGLGSPKVTTLLRAYTLTGNEIYLQAAILGCQFSAGANPNNMTFTTGLGHRSPQHPLVIDQRVLGISPPLGITVFGPIDTDSGSFADRRLAGPDAGFGDQCLEIGIRQRGSRKQQSCQCK